MERLKHIVLYLILALVFFFNIERLDFNQENIVNIHSFVYVLAIIAVFSIIITPIFARFSAVFSVFVWLSVYFALYLIFLSGQALLINIYITVTEIVMIATLVVLSHQVARAIQEFKQAVETVTMVHLRGSALLLDEAGDYIRKEMRRSRQYQRVLSVIVATPDLQTMEAPLPPLVQEVQNTIANRFARAKLAKMISNEVPLINTVMEDRENDRFIIVCPEVDEANALILSERICATINQNLGVDVRCGTASFPDKALTFEELVAQAKKSERPYSGHLCADKSNVLLST